MSRRRFVTATVIVLVALVALGAGWWGVSRSITTAADAVGRNEIAADGSVQGKLYPGDPTAEAALVSKESERVNYVRAISAAARWRVDGLHGPYRLQTGTSTTLVFPARKKAYTLADLRAAAPDTFVEQADGSYLLKENVAVLAGATLSLTSPKLSELRLESDPSRFVSIISLGGSLVLKGSHGHPLAVTSWDTGSDAADAQTSDGRAYIRAIGGSASISHAGFSDLGFWSGDTGGLALTGTDVVSSVDAATTSAKVGVHLHGARLLPNAEVNTLATSAVSDYGPVSAKVHAVTVTGNAYGLFVTNARHVSVRGSTITGSLIDGLAIHRDVKKTTIVRTVSSSNYVDGFSLDRSSTGVTYKTVSATNNGRNGISMDGRALADGPTAIGTGTKVYGKNAVVDSTVTGNGRYGVEISGGRHERVTASSFVGNGAGVVVDHAATDVTVSGNRFTGAVSQAISIRDGETKTSVTNNRIFGAVTGVYVRDAATTVRGNTFSAVSNHGITLVGTVHGTVVAANTLTGYGPEAIWSATAMGGRIGQNDAEDWHQALSPARVAHTIFQPLTFVWLLLALLLVVSAFTRRRRLRVRAIRSPYPEHVPLTSLSRGIVRTPATETSIREDAL